MPDTIEHALYPVRAKDKMRLLETVLDEEGFTSAIVFLRTKHRAKQLAKHLSEHGPGVGAEQRRCAPTGVAGQLPQRAAEQLEAGVGRMRC